MKINSVKKVLLCGVIYGLLTFIIYVAFTCAVYYLLKGENFVHKFETETINGISLVEVEIAGMIISALIPLLLIRFKDFKYYALTFFVAALSYIFLLFILFGIVPFSIIKKLPLNSFDALIYGTYDFPLGALIGMLLTAILNYILNKKHSETK